MLITEIHLKASPTCQIFNENKHWIIGTDFIVSIRKLPSRGVSECILLFVPSATELRSAVHRLSVRWTSIFAKVCFQPFPDSIQRQFSPMKAHQYNPSCWQKKEQELDVALDLDASVTNPTRPSRQLEKVFCNESRFKAIEVNII